MLTAGELGRYARQLALPEITVAHQERLQTSRVLIVGAGGLGSPVALYLAAAGTGCLGIVDDDVVEISNLHRQVVHGTPDIGRGKTESAADAIRRLNPGVDVRLHSQRLTSGNADDIIRGYDLVVDGSDNYATRYAVNDACVRAEMPWVYGSVERFSGQVSVFGLPNGPCYRCVFPEAPPPGSSPSCEEIGVLGAVPGVIGSMQAVEALKVLLGIGTPLSGRLQQWDFRSGTMQEITIDRRADCAACGARAPGLRAMIPDAPLPAEILPEELAARLARPDAPALVDVREPWEWQRGVIGKPQLLSMQDLPQRLDSLDPEAEMVVYCHHGVRSRMAADWLRAQGFRVRNLSGGIDRWSREIDPSVPRY